MAVKQFIPSALHYFCPVELCDMSTEEAKDTIEQSPTEVLNDLQEILKGLESSIRQQPALEIEDSVHEAQDRFQSLVDTLPSQASTDEEENEKEEPEEVEWEAPLHQAQSRLKELVNIFEEKLTKEREEHRKEQTQNLEAKQALIKEMESIITTEDSIAKAFQHFNDLQARWKGIGDVSHAAYQKLQGAYSYQIERFYYTINIYKDLKDLDLKKNLEAKQELVKQMQELRKESSTKRMELMVKAYQEEWEETGPVPREDWEQVRDAFREATRAVYGKIQEFYDGLKKQFQANLEKKETLIQQAHVISELELKSPKKWNSKTQEILELQKQWKKIGFAPKAHNERVWKEFRDACNQFFNRKKQYFRDLRDKQGEHKDAKLALIKKAETLKVDTNWKETTRKFIDLQKQWKDIGPADRKDEQTLWKTFREHCDYFFERKKHFFDTLDDRQAENLEEKKKLIRELEAFTPGADVKTNIAALKQFTEQWNEIGHVPRKEMGKVNDQFQSLMNKHYDKLDLKKEEKTFIRYKNRLELLTQLDNARPALDKERQQLRIRIRELDEMVQQYETNLGRFNVSKGGSAILDQVMEKIEGAKSEREELLRKLDYVTKLFKKA